MGVKTRNSALIEYFAKSLTITRNDNSRNLDMDSYLHFIVTMAAWPYLTLFSRQSVMFFENLDFSMPT